LVKKQQPAQSREVSSLARVHASPIVRWKLDRDDFVQSVRLKLQKVVRGFEVHDIKCKVAWKCFGKEPAYTKHRCDDALP
jgi:hypothetical protein